jgi:hypothetical protein
MRTWTCTRTRTRTATRTHCGAIVLVLVLVRVRVRVLVHEALLTESGRPLRSRSFAPAQSPRSPSRRQGPGNRPGHGS